MAFYKTGGEGVSFSELMQMSAKEKAQRRVGAMTQLSVPMPNPVPIQQGKDTKWTPADFAKVAPPGFSWDINNDKIDKVVLGAESYKLMPSARCCLLKPSDVSQVPMKTIVAMGAIGGVQPPTSLVDIIEGKDATLTDEELNQYYTSVTAAFPELCWDRCVIDVPDTPFASIDIADVTERFIPLKPFNPVWDETNYWKLPFSVLLGVVPVYHKPTVDTRQMYLTCLAFSETYALTNRTSYGQGQRFKGCWELAKWSDQKFKANDIQVYEQKFRSALMACNPCDVSSIDQWDLLDCLGEGSAYLRIKRESDAGYTSFTTDPAKIVKRGECFYYDVFTHQRCIEKIRLGANVDHMCDHLSMHVFSKLKPKYEIIERAKAYKKVRSVIVLPSWVQLGAGIVTQRFTKILSSRPDDPLSLYGWVPLDLGMDRLLAEVLDRAARFEKRYIFCYYSDNLFIFDSAELVWLSLDAEKMESSSIRKEQEWVADHILDKCAVQDPGLRKFLNYTMAQCCSFTKSVFGGVCTTFPGLSSGSQTTFIMNHMRMMVYAYYFQHEIFNDESVMPAAVDELIDTRNFPVKIALTGRSDLFETTGLTANVRYATLKSVIEGQVSPGDLETFGPIVPMDVLGYDATPILLDGSVVWLSCLNYKRLMRSIVYRKTEFKEEASIIPVLHLMAIYALFMMGGFAYPDAHDIICMCASTLKDGIRKHLETKHPCQDPVNNKEVIQYIASLYRAYLDNSEESGIHHDVSDLSVASGLLRFVFTNGDMFTRAKVIRMFHLGERERKSKQLIGKKRKSEEEHILEEPFSL